MKAWIGATALAGMLANGGAMAASGNEMLSWCSGLESQQRFETFTTGYCIGIIQAVNDLMPFVPENARACPPGEMTNGQAARITVKYLKQNPEKLHLSGTALTVMALQNAYPCK